MHVVIRRCALVTTLLLLANVSALAQLAPSAQPNLQLQLPGSSKEFLAATLHARLRRPDGKLPVGGHFIPLGDGTTRPRLLRRKIDGSLYAGFSLQITSVASACVVYLLASTDGCNLGVGSFDAAYSSTKSDVVQSDPDRATAGESNSTPVEERPGQRIRILAATSSSLFTSGNTQIDNASSLGRLDAWSGDRAIARSTAQGTRQ